MKVYVDELPKSCGDCVFCKQTEYYYYCDKLCMKLGYINKEKECPLQSLSDYTKQVRKKVCEEIRVKAEDKYFEIGEDGEIPISWIISEERLKQIEQGETNGSRR